MIEGPLRQTAAPRKAETSRLKRAADRRIVLTSVRRKCRLRNRRPPGECPPLFSGQQEGFREHAVSFPGLRAPWTGSWKIGRLHIKEIGYGQQ